MTFSRTRSRSRDTATRSRRALRVAATVLAAVLLAVAAAGLVAHWRAPGRSTSLGVSAFSPYLMLGAPVAVLLLGLARRWPAMVAGVLVTVLCASTQSRLYVAETPPAHAVGLQVMTANLRLGQGDPAAVVRAVQAHHVDVLMVQELTEQELARLERAGLDDALPYHATDARYSATGTGLWSRYPLASVDRRTDFTFAFVTARIEVPGRGDPVTVVALHTSGPVPDATYWHRDMAHLPGVLHQLAAGGSVVVGGDFNATPDVAQFRDLLGDGYADGAQQAGAGMTPTYPADKHYPPLIAIDHVLTHEAVATRADTVHIPGSDHRALLVRVAVPT